MRTPAIAIRDGDEQRDRRVDPLRVVNATSTSPSSTAADDATSALRCSASASERDGPGFACAPADDARDARC